MATSLNVLKESALPPSPILLIDITDSEGHVRRFATQSLTYSGNAYEARVIEENIEAIQALSPQGFDSIPSLSITLADPDGFLWSNYISPYRWKGGTLKVTYVQWDASTAATGFSSDAYVWKFITDNPSYSAGIITVGGTNKLNFSRIKLPSPLIQRRCSWIFPGTISKATPTTADLALAAAQRQDGADNPISPYYQCGYSPDASGSNARGNMDPITGQPFRGCNLTKEDCIARGMYSHDSASRSTFRFGGMSWSPPTTFGGRKYTSGEQISGYNAFNDARYGKPHNLLYGTQWVNAKVMVPAADPNSLRFEASVCLAPYGSVSGPKGTNLKVLVNGVEIPYNNTADRLFTWYFVNPGGRTGHINTDAIFDEQGDPWGSIASIEPVVPSELAQGGSIPTCRVLVSAGPIMVPTTPSGDYGLIPQITWNPAWHLLDVCTWCDYQYTDCDIQTFMEASVFCGYSGQVTASGTTVAYSSTINRSTGNYDSFCLAFVGKTIIIGGNPYLVDAVASSTSLTTHTSVTGSGVMDYSVNNISYTALDGTTRTHERFRSSFVLEDRKVASQLLTAMRNANNFILSPNSSTGLLQLFVKQTLADQQPSPVSGSNYSTAISSLKADRTVANGYSAYHFDFASIVPGTFKVTAKPLSDVGNEVQFQFQDEDNQYQDDSISQIDPEAYTAAGNQELLLPFEAAGIVNFDQAARISNVRLSEENRGNPRDDAGGSLGFQFRTSIKASHLANRIGLICTLSWPQLLLDHQLIRIIGAKPTSNASYWDITAQWHMDDWYTDQYDQDPTPYYHNPYHDAISSLPLPWRPGYHAFPTTDALYPQGSDFHTSFRTPVLNQVNLDGSLTPVVSLYGYLPVNNLSDLVEAPFVPIQAQAASTGGTLVAGEYLIVVCAYDSAGAYSPPSHVIRGSIPAGVTTGSLTVPNIVWSSGTSGYAIWGGTSVFDLGSPPYISAYGVSGTPSSVTFAGEDFTLGPPDPNANKILVRAKEITVAGVFEGRVTAIDSSIDTVYFGGSPSPLTWTTNQWAGRVLSIIGRSNSSGIAAEGIYPYQQNFTIVSNGSTSLVLDRDPGLIDVSDWAVICIKPSAVTSRDFHDSMLSIAANSHIGELVYIIGGTGAYQPPQTIIATDSTGFAIADDWPITPDATSVFIICEPTNTFEKESDSFQNGTLVRNSKIISFQTDNLPKNLLIQGITEDSDGKMSVVSYAPFQRVHLYGAVGSLSIGGGVTFNGDPVTY